MSNCGPARPKSCGQSSYLKRMCYLSAGSVYQNMCSESSDFLQFIHRFFECSAIKIAPEDCRLQAVGEWRVRRKESPRGYPAHPPTRRIIARCALANHFLSVYHSTYENVCFSHILELRPAPSPGCL